jgi:hypothetical protein
MTWPLGGNVRLGTSSGRSRSSASAGSDWINPARAVALSGSAPVGPNGSGWFDLSLHGNGRSPGTTVESFEPVYDGYQWIPGALTTLTVVRTDSASRNAERFYVSPAWSPLNAPTGTGTIRVRLRNVGSSPWTVGQEGLTTTTDSPFATPAWSSRSRPPALSSNLTRPGQTAVYPGELGEWLVPVSAFKVKAGSYSLGFRPVGPDGAYGPTSTVAVNVKDGVFAGSAVSVHPRVSMTSTGTARFWFDVKNTGNVAWPIGTGAAVRSVAWTPGGSPSADPSWLSRARPGTILSNLTTPGATSVAPGQVARFYFLLNGNGRSARTTSEPFGIVWEGWASASLRVTVPYTVTG